MNINQKQEPDYETVNISYVGLVDPSGIEGIVILKTDGGRELHVRAFTGEVAQYIGIFKTSQYDEIPSIYKMIESICEENEIYLVKVKIYSTGQVFRANLYFTGRRDMILRNYRASDAIALAAYYKIPILVRKNLFDDAEANSSTFISSMGTDV